MIGPGTPVVRTGVEVLVGMGISVGKFVRSDGTGEAVEVDGWEGTGSPEAVWVVPEVGVM
jgi:hypothetical protein